MYEKLHKRLHKRLHKNLLMRKNQTIPLPHAEVKRLATAQSIHVNTLRYRWKTGHKETIAAILKRQLEIQKSQEEVEILKETAKQLNRRNQK